MSKRKGDSRERRALNYFEDSLGIYAQRTGSSGGGTSRNRPDIVALKPAQDLDIQLVEDLKSVLEGEKLEQVLALLNRELDLADVYFIEMKAREDPICRFTKEEIVNLKEAADRAGATPLVIIFPNLKKWDHAHCFTIDDLKENEKSYSVTKDHLPGMTYKEAFGMDE